MVVVRAYMDYNPASYLVNVLGGNLFLKIWSLKPGVQLSMSISLVQECV